MEDQYLVGRQKWQEIEKIASFASEAAEIQENSFESTMRKLYLFSTHEDWMNAIECSKFEELFDDPTIQALIQLPVVAHRIRLNAPSQRSRAKHLCRWDYHFPQLALFKRDKLSKLVQAKKRIGAMNDLIGRLENGEVKFEDALKEAELILGDEEEEEKEKRDVSIQRDGEIFSLSVDGVVCVKFSLKDLDESMFRFVSTALDRYKCTYSVNDKGELVAWTDDGGETKGKWVSAKPDVRNYFEDKGVNFND